MDRRCASATGLKGPRNSFSVRIAELAGLRYNPPSFSKIKTSGDGTLSFRIGIGHDTHRLESGGPLRLGGIDIPFEYHAVGHSDADVLLHAVTDALLGATGNGDIGELFPNTDEANRDRDSAEFLAAAVRLVHEAGFGIVNFDCIVFAQRPKLSPYKRELTDNLARMLAVSSDQVNIKAKTGEHVGPVGRGEAIMAECMVLLASRSDESLANKNT